MQWQPSFGAWREGDGTRFRVWAPRGKHVEVVLYAADGSRRVQTLSRAEDGFYSAVVPGVAAGTRYKYRLDGDQAYPDPASRFQPEGVHGVSEVVDPTRFSWHDQNWHGLAGRELVIYELHVGTFTPQGTYQGVAEKLPELVELGISAIELMPLGDFPGQRDWGYDGVAMFAPARCYGTPEELHRLVDQAHQLGLAVFLDVIYNHFGPDGNYVGVYSPYFESQKHRSPWGAGLNFDGEYCQIVRQFFIDNALYWLRDYHFDGLRLDATHAIVDQGPRHFLAELAARIRETITERPVRLIAEDHRNLNTLLLPPAKGGWGLDGVWADDFHHEMRRLLAGDREGYYRDYTGTTTDLAATIQQGWFFCGQYSEHLEEDRGTDPTGLPSQAFVLCLQNHDQVGNRAFGRRLHQQIDLAAYRAASALLLCLPQTPLLFMGQEWAATSPFLFFTDHNPELGKLVTEGRRREFKQFSAFSDPAIREMIPDPQAESTFAQSRLRWEERSRQPFAGIWELYKVLLALRRREPALHTVATVQHRCVPVTDKALVLHRWAEGAPAMLLICQLKGFGVLNLATVAGLEALAQRRWEVVLTTEEERFAADAQPLRHKLDTDFPVFELGRPCAVLLRERK